MYIHELNLKKNKRKQIEEKNPDFICQITSGWYLANQKQSHQLYGNSEFVLVLKVVVGMSKINILKRQCHTLIQWSNIAFFRFARSRLDVI
jgi:hypothetical protein